MAGMIDPRLRQMVPGMGAPPGPVPNMPLTATPGFRPPGVMPAPSMVAQQSGMNPLALLGIASMMGGKGGDKSISSMSPASFNGVIEGMSGADAQRYLGGLPGQGGGFMNWVRGLF